MPTVLLIATVLEPLQVCTIIYLLINNLNSQKITLILAGTSAYTHDCAPTGTEKEACEEKDLAGVKTKYCYCKGALCNKFNSAMGVEVSKILMVAGAILAAYYHH